MGCSIFFAKYVEIIVPTTMHKTAINEDEVKTPVNMSNLNFSKTYIIAKVKIMDAVMIMAIISAKICEISSFSLNLRIMLHHFESQSAYGFDFELLVLFEPLPQSANMHINSVGVTFCVHSPYLVHQLLLCKNLVRI